MQLAKSERPCSRVTFIGRLLRQVTFGSVLIASLSSCVKYYPYQTFEFLGDAVAVQYGKPSSGKIGTRGVVEFPVLYEVSRPQYSLYIAVDPNQNIPTAVFSAQDNNSVNLPVIGESMECLAKFWPWVIGDLAQRQPYAKETFQWNPTDYGVCGTRDLNESGVHEVRVRIIHDQEQHHVSLRFRVVRNGLIREFDAL